MAVGLLYLQLPLYLLYLHYTCHRLVVEWACIKQLPAYTRQPQPQQQPTAVVATATLIPRTLWLTTTAPQTLQPHPIIWRLPPLHGHRDRQRAAGVVLLCQRRRLNPRKGTHRRLMDGCCGTFCSSCWMILDKFTLPIYSGKIRRPVFLRLLTPRVWPASGAYRRTTCPWTMTRCPAPSDTITESISLGRFRESDTATSFWEIPQSWKV